jgi:hypothetical protein
VLPPRGPGVARRWQGLLLACVAVLVMAAVAREALRAPWRAPATDVTASAAAARASLPSRPLDGRHYRDLALAAERAGDTDDARRWMEIAARRTPRDRIARAWLADDATARGDGGSTFAHVDALLRMDALLRAAFAPRLALLAGDQGALRARLLGAIRSGAPWRREVVLAWLGGGATLGEARALVAGLGTPTREERDAWAARLAASGAWREARAAAGDGDALFDGGFGQAGHGPFDWRLQGGEGSRVERVLTGDRQIVLRVEFDGARVSAPPVEQRLALAAGRHRFTVAGRAESLASGDGISWHIDCEDGRPLASTVPMAASSVWRRLEANFVVPMGCPVQWLRLRVPAGADRSPRGVAWFDAASVMRVGAPGASGSAPPVPVEDRAATPEARALFADRARSFRALAVARRMPDAPLGP